MAVTISDNYQAKYTSKWGVLLQQIASRLNDFVTVYQDCSGTVKYVDQYGLLDFDQKTGRMQQTVLTEAPTLRRALYPTFFTKAVGFDEFDAKKLGEIDVPVSQTIEGLRSAAARKMDDVMIAGFLGDCRKGENGEVVVPFPAGRTVSKNYVATGSVADSGLTIPKLLETLRMHMVSEAWSDDQAAAGDKLVFACSSQQILDLLRTVEATSSDFTDVKALYEGKVDTFMGFKFIRTERLPVDAGVRSCLSWVKSRAAFGMWSDFKVKLSVRDDVDEALQIRAKFGCGATRLEEEGFVKVLCKQ